MSTEEVGFEEEARLRRSARIARNRRDVWSEWPNSVGISRSNTREDSWSVGSTVGTVIESEDLKDGNRMSKKVVVDSDGDLGRGSEQPGVSEMFQLMMAENRRRDADARRREEESVRREERWAAQRDSRPHLIKGPFYS